MTLWLTLEASMIHLVYWTIIRLSSKTTIQTKMFVYLQQVLFIYILDNKLYQTLSRQFFKRKRKDWLSNPKSIMKLSHTSNKKFMIISSSLWMQMIMESAKLRENKFLVSQPLCGVELQNWIPCGGRKELMIIQDLSRLWKLLMKSLYPKWRVPFWDLYKLKELLKMPSWNENKHIPVEKLCYLKNIFLG